MLGFTVERFTSTLCLNSPSLVKVLRKTNWVVTKHDLCFVALRDTGCAYNP